MINPEQFIEFLIKNDLTFGQYIALYAIYHNKLSLITTFKAKFQVLLEPYERQNLIDRKLIEISIVKGKEKVTLTKTGSAIFISDFEAGNEFWDLYPDYNKSNMPLKLVAKNHWRLNYANVIKGNIQEHREIIEDLKFGVSQGLVVGKIDTFLDSEAYLGLRKQRKELQTSTNETREF